MSWNILYIIDLGALLLFVVSYYRSCHRMGYRIDFWHAELVLFCVVPYMLLLPFARNDLNAVIVGQDFAAVVAAVPTVFLIAMLGYLAVLFGGALWRIKLGIGLRKAVARTLDIGPRCSVMLMSSRELLVSLSLLCLCCQSLILAIYFSHDGFGFDLRAYTFANPGIRPFAQIVALSTLVIASHCLARYVDTKERVLLACTLLLTLGLLFFGQRTTVALIYMNVALCYLMKLRSKISLLRIFGLTAALVAMVLYLGNVREGSYSIAEFFASLAFLTVYGNTFCDLRDFAWIYTNWNHELWLGKTYLAGLATFLPRGDSQFRATWTFGVATDLTVGLNTELHPGLKPGLFGESFFNFGLLGAIGVGLVFGIVLRYVDDRVRATLQSARPSVVQAFASTMLLTVVGCLNTSLGLPALYALCGIYVLAWSYLRARALFVPLRSLPASVR